MKRKLSLLLLGGLIFVMVFNVAAIAFAGPTQQALTSESTI